MSTTTTPAHVNTDPSALGLATVALLRKVGVRGVPIEVVNEQAHTVRTDGSTIRVRAMGDSHVTRMVGGAHSHPQGLTAGDVLVAYYDHRPALVRQDILATGPGSYVVERFQRMVPGQIDVVTFDVRPGPSGRLGSAGATSQIVSLGVLPEVPAAMTGIHGVEAQLANRIMSASVAVTGIYAGTSRTKAKGVRSNMTATTPGGAGVFTRTGEAVVEVWPVSGTGYGRADAVGQARRTIESLGGWSWAGLGGRITSIRVAGSGSSDNGNVALTVHLTIAGRKPGNGEVR